MADEQDNAAKKRTFRKFTYRGIDLERILELSNEELMGLVTARARRRFNRGMKRKPMALIKRLRKSKKNAPAHEKPDTVKTHLRNMIIVPEMIGSVCGVYNGKTFITVEIKVRSRACGAVACPVALASWLFRVTHLTPSSFSPRWLATTWLSSLSRTSP